jgi:hypothetical protein
MLATITTAAAVEISFRELVYLAPGTDSRQSIIDGLKSDDEDDGLAAEKHIPIVRR